MSTSYSYSIAIYFPYGYNPEMLSRAVFNNTTITKFLSSITSSTSGTKSVVFTFATALTTVEQTALTSVVNSYVPGPNGSTLMITNASSNTAAINVNATDPSSGIYVQSGNSGIILNTAGFLNLRATLGVTKMQITETLLPTTSTITLLPTDLITGILYGTPTINTTIVLPNASDIVSYFPTISVYDSIEFSIINNSATNIVTSISYTLIIGTGGTLIGNQTIGYAKSGLFRLKLTNTTSGSESYLIYRIV